MRLNINSCWTCRLRHKKCDERFPTCITCDRLEIPCYRSENNKKPEFMDGGEKEKQMSIEISAAVKAKNDSQRRSRALEAKAKRRRQCQLQSQETAPTNSFSSRDYVGVTAGERKISGTDNLKYQDSWDHTPGPVVSCEAWVKVLVDEIHILRLRKGRDQVLKNQPSQVQNFHSKADKIQDHLEEGLRCLVQKYTELSETTSTLHHADIENVEAKVEVHLQLMKIWVSSLYVRAALIYLHIILHGTESQGVPTIKGLVFEWTFNFRFLPDSTLLPDLVWPLCIAGCMAMTTKQRQFFRDTVLSSGIELESPCMIWRALEIMEKCWERFKSDGVWSGELEWMDDLDALWDLVVFG